MRIGYILILVVLAPFLTLGQKHRVYFTDKGENLALRDCPEQFLSAASLERRARQNIALQTNDLPVSAHYIKALKAEGLSVKFASRWFNYALVEGEITAGVYNLPFVSRVEVPLKYEVHFAEAAQQNFNYGFARRQIEMLNGQSLHQAGFTGRGMRIAVLDGGFSGTDTIAAFDSLWAENRVAGTYNFVSNDTNVFVVGSHGTSVLSTMAALIPSDIVGTAPHATYFLLRSENELSETPQEMDNWLAAAEYADSAGADVINSSLGYSTFDNPANSFSYSDMDGATTLVTKAADMAASKGIAVVVSAGNEGSSSWRYITAPADGDSVLTVGAVDAQEAYVSFSSQGPSYDGRIKPDVAALGLGATAVNAAGILVPLSGTSFSSPIVAGLTACLLQAKPQVPAHQVLQHIRLTASQFNNPDVFIGYGIPNFQQARAIGQEELNSPNWAVYPNPFTDRLRLRFAGFLSAERPQLKIMDLNGQLVWHEKLSLEDGYEINVQVDLAPGIYLLQIQLNHSKFTQKIVRL